MIHRFREIRRHGDRLLGGGLAWLALHKAGDRRFPWPRWNPPWRKR